MIPDRPLLTASPDAPARPAAGGVDQERPTPAPSGLILIRLAELPEQAILDEAALAGSLGVTMRTIRRMVGRYELPPPIRFGGRSSWQAGAVLRWFAERAEKAARDAERRAQAIEKHRPLT